MYIRRSKLFAIACFILLITACSNEPSIISATSDKVIVGGPPEKFTAAYDLAKKECLKNTKTAEYFPDSTVGLNEVAFNCMSPEEKLAATEEIATEVEENPEATEGAQKETDAVSTQEVQ